MAARVSWAPLAPAEVDAIWVRLKAGCAAKIAAREVGLPTSTVRSYLTRCGGIQPVPRRRGETRLRLGEREEISRGLAAGLSVRAIAAGLGRAPSTVSREIVANGGVAGIELWPLIRLPGREQRGPSGASSRYSRSYVPSWNTS